MSDFIAKIGSEYKSILHKDDDLLNSIDISISDPIDYEYDYKLDENQWFRIQQFSEKGFYIEECSKDFSTASINQIRNAEYSRISNICIIQDEQIQFQRITPSFYINKKTVLDYSGAPKIVEHRKQIEVRNEPDAVYIAENDTLYFKSLSKIKTIFPGIEMLQREATQQEVNTFLENDFIKLSGYPPDSVGVYNRKRINDVATKYQNLDDIKKEKLITYAKEKSGIKLENNAMVIDSEVALKTLLYAMDQRYYYADIYEENRLANSVRIIN